MYKILLADDEAIIREGIKTLFNWEDIGYEICGEATNGDQTLAMIRSLNPDVVLLDIRMPKMTGIDVIATARSEGFEGFVIILSGYSDFRYAQEAIRFRASDYLTKPVDEDKLEEILKRIKSTLDGQLIQSSGSTELMSRARKAMLEDLLVGKISPSADTYKDCGLTDTCYQIVLTEKYGMLNNDASYDFGELMRVSGHSLRSFEQINPDGTNCILLKGTSAINRFKDFLSRYDSDNLPQKDSPLDTLFFTYGHVVEDPSDLPHSYAEASWLLSRRFFCDQGQHILSFTDLPELENTTPVLSDEILSNYVNRLFNTISAFNRNQVAEILTELKKSLFSASDSISDIRLFLSDLFLQVKALLSQRYPDAEKILPSNQAILQKVQGSHYLYETILYFSQTYETIMTALGNSSRDSVLNDVLYYVDHNYTDNITLENIAPLFGYNSSYLGKIFTKKMGISFNTYVEHVRLDRSKELLLREDLKVYAIAEQVGYRNVDYFHIKFKKYTGMSPAEFRKKTKDDV